MVGTPRHDVPVELNSWQRSLVMEIHWVYTVSGIRGWATVNFLVKYMQLMNHFLIM